MEFLYHPHNAVNGQGCDQGYDQIEHREVSNCPVLGIEDLGSTDMPSILTGRSSIIAVNGSQSSVLINSFLVITCFCSRNSSRYLQVSFCCGGVQSDSR